MKKLKKGIVVALALCMSLAVFSGCDNDNNNASNSPSATPSTSASASPSGSTGAQSEKDINAGKEKVKLSMILCSSGLSIPDGIDINNNAWTDAIKEWANVDLDIDQPLYADYDQKLQLRISAADLPDIVHCIGTSYTTTAPQAARDGAFVDLTDYYANSRNVKNVISAEQMEWVKESTTGKNFFIPMRYEGLPQGEWLIARWDLVEKYNNGAWPKTTPEWIALFEKIKQEMPDAMVLSNRLQKAGYALSYGGRVIYKLYGLSGPSGGGFVWDYDNQKIEHEFVTPEYKAATKVMKDLYEKGVLDKEFATTEKWFDNKKTKNIVAEANAGNQVALTKTVYADYPEGNSQVWKMADPLTEFPAEVRYPEVAYGTKTNGLSGHAMYISSACKNPDRAFDVLEVMASEEFRDLCAWGTEGFSYTMEGDEKVPIAEVTKLDPTDPGVFRWQRQFLTIWGFPSSRPYDEAVAKLADEEFTNSQIESTKAVNDIVDALSISPTSLTGYVPSENVTRKSTESKAEMSTITCNYIMGKMSDADFDKAIADWQAEYGFIADEFSEYVNSFDKAKAEAMGVKFTLD